MSSTRICGQSAAVRTGVAAGECPARRDDRRRRQNDPSFIPASCARSKRAPRASARGRQRIGRRASG